MRLETMEDQEEMIMSDGSPRGVSKRRANKHLIERRRRARINCSLTQLKSLVLEGMKKDPARYNRLEKADILEMTVTHLRTVKNQQSSEAALSARYTTGYKECALEIARFLASLPGMEDGVKSNILSHVEDCLHRAKTTPEDATHLPPGSPSAAMLETADRCEPLDLSRTGRKPAEMGLGEEMEFYTIQKYGSSDAESVASSHDLDLSTTSHCHSPSRDMQMSHDVRRTCAENADSGVDDDVTSGDDQVMRGDGSEAGGACVEREDYPGEDGDIHIQDDSMWRPW